LNANVLLLLRVNANVLLLFQVNANMLLLLRVNANVLLLFQVNANGNVMSSDIVGCIKLKTMLSGMPELRLGLNDRVLFALTGRTDTQLLSASLSVCLVKIFYLFL